jgi:hypothetical protein
MERVSLRMKDTLHHYQRFRLFSFCFRRSNLNHYLTFDKEAFSLAKKDISSRKKDIHLDRKEHFFKRKNEIPAESEK